MWISTLRRELLSKLLKIEWKFHISDFTKEFIVPFINLPVKSWLFSWENVVLLIDLPVILVSTFLFKSTSEYFLNKIMYFKWPRYKMRTNAHIFASFIAFSYLKCFSHRYIETLYVYGQVIQKFKVTEKRAKIFPYFFRSLSMIIWFSITPPPLA